MTKIPNNWLFIIFEIWNLFGPILRSGGACNLLFPIYEFGICSSNFGIDSCPAGATFSERSLEKSLVPIYSNPIMFAKDFSNKIFSPPDEV